MTTQIDQKYFQLSDKLTGRECEVALLMLDQVSYEEIANSLFIQESTLRKHCSNIYKKAEVKNRLEFKAKFPILKDYLKSRITPVPLERSLGESINLNWEEGNVFEEYFSEFNEVIESMYKLDFSKRLLESDQKDNFLNFIAKSLNGVNDELQTRYVGGELIPKILECLSKKNQIILVSQDGRTISNCFDSLNGGFINSEKFVGLKLSDIVSKNHIEEAFRQRKIQFKARLDHHFFPKSLVGLAEFKYEKLGRYWVLVISTNPENLLQGHLPRVLSLLSCIESECADNPALYQSIVGQSICSEASSLLRELHDLYVHHD